VVKTTDLIYQLLLFCGVLAIPVLVAFIATASLITPDYSHVSDTISLLGAHGQQHPEIMNAGFIVHALLLNGFAYGLYICLGLSIGARIIWILMAICGIGLICSAIFQDDLHAPNAATSLEGLLHNIFSQLAFFAFLVAMVVFARIIHNKPSWSTFSQFTIAIVCLNLLLSLTFLTEIAASIEGALQRSSMALSLLWLIAVAVHALRLSVGYPATPPVERKLYQGRSEQ
jgi:hypothetical membrane protein